MTHIPSPAEELRFLDAELRQLDARRSQLLARRGWLVATLEAARPAPAFAPPRPEASPPRVQNVLLLLGGTLLTIAAMAFTLVGWGHLGTAGRSAVLGAITVAALAAPLPLLARGLRSTAEAVAGLGLALTVLDAYALHEVALGEVDGLGYTAVAAAVLAVLWTAYGLLPRTAQLRLPLPAALAAAQLPLLWWVPAADGGPYGLAAALLVTAGFDTAVALRVPARSVRIVAAVGAYGLGAGGVLTAGGLSWTATGPSAAARAAALLLLAALIALTAARRTAAVAAPLGGLLLVAALGGVPRVVLPEVWTVPVHLACGVALLAAVRVQRLPEPVRRGLGQASAAVQALAVLWAAPLVAVTLLGPLAWIDRPWSGAPSDIRAAVTAQVPWPAQSETAPLVLAAVAAVLALSARPGARTAALVLGGATALVLPPVLQLPYEAGLLAALTVVALALVPAAPTAACLAVAASLHAASLALAAQSATLTVLTALTLLFAAASRRRTLVAAPAALAWATALACAIGAAAGWAPQHTALLVLTVPVAAALLAPRAAEAALPVEVTGAAAGLLAIALTSADPPSLALVLALCGVITAATALRPDRRRVGYASTALFVLAAWVRLAAWEVGAPEAYTLPVTIPALLVGALRRRREPGTSSWTAYGPGLAATLLPSLVAAWADPHWTRPLLLGLAALSLTLLGGGHQLQAPLLLGGATLLLDALHELAPYLIQVAGALPRWAAPALAGLLLLALGATYEQRIRDVRRVQGILGKMT
ncbi:SCO7613 C-terminal domain-containing membrane protein [Streptomyces sp. NPDC052415]|uniref:SCO7613 C-terminal domain-containing membrane protein n=1 Tax=Streptomyces sp. NPDC052415 TaxID=3365690 RepID=UPI0037CFFF2F